MQMFMFVVYVYVDADVLEYADVDVDVDVDVSVLRYMNIQMIMQGMCQSILNQISASITLEAKLRATTPWNKALGQTSV